MVCQRVKTNTQENAWPDATWTDLAARRSDPKPKEEIEKKWALAGKIYAGAAVPTCDSAEVCSGKAYKQFMVESIPFILNDQVSETEHVRLEAMYKEEIFNVTFKNAFGKPIKGAVVPGHRGPIAVTHHLESLCPHI